MISCTRTVALFMLASALISPRTVLAQSRGCDSDPINIERSFDQRLNDNVRKAIVKNAKIGLTLGAAATIFFPAAVGVGGAFAIAAGFTLLGGMLPAAFRTASDEAFSQFDNAFGMF